jgi:hypothetical protein
MLKTTRLIETEDKFAAGMLNETLTHIYLVILYAHIEGPD